MSDAPWIDVPDGRVAVSASGYAKDYIGQWTYALNADRVVRFDGPVLLFGTLPEVTAYGTVLAEPAQTLTSSGAVFKYVTAGFTLGNGTITATYHRSWNRLDCTIALTVGSTTSFAGLTLFIAYNDFLAGVAPNSMSHWYGHLRDASTSTIYPLTPGNPTGATAWYDGDVSTFRVNLAGSAFVGSVEGLTTPVPLAVGDEIVIGRGWTVGVPGQNEA